MSNDAQVLSMEDEFGNRGRHISLDEYPTSKLLAATPQKDRSLGNSGKAFCQVREP